MSAHAKNYPPSASKRWLSCGASATVIAQLYPNFETEASLKGDVAHKALEHGITFGLTPDTGDIDVDLNVMSVLGWVADMRAAYGKDCVVHAERQYDIPETGEFGTCDVTFVTPSTLHIADYKNGYVPVEEGMNPQLLLYLLGAIAAFGTRKHYKITVLQPNYIHRDGPHRTVDITDEQIEWFRREVKYALDNPNDFKAGKHCKTTYCPHRASCIDFHAYARTDARLAWFPSDVNALDDTQLAQALDHADTLHGIRDELRREAMRRILNQDRTIDGYKIVKARQDRQFVSDEARDKLFEACKELGATDEDLYAKTPQSVAGVERFFKAKFKMFGNGKWKMAWDNAAAEHVREYTGGLTLERAIDGRPSHVRGGELGAITSAAPLVI